MRILILWTYLMLCFISGRLLAARRVGFIEIILHQLGHDHLVVLVRSCFPGSVDLIDLLLAPSMNIPGYAFGWVITDVGDKHLEEEFITVILNNR